MGFLRNLAGAFQKQPLIFRLLPVQEGVKVSILRGGESLSYEEMTAPKLLKYFPAAFTNYLKSKPKRIDHGYVVPLPFALNVLTFLEANAADEFEFDCAAVKNLQTVNQPPEFRIKWRYDANNRRLQRDLIHADAYLGMGWFQRERHIWSIGQNIPEALMAWLNLPQIPSAYIYQFIAEVLPAAQPLNLPLACEVTLETEWNVTLKVVKMLSKSVDFGLETNPPDLLTNLHFLEGDSANMIGGNRLWVGLATVINRRLYRIVQEPNGVLRLKGSELLEFIQDDVAPQADKLGVDLERLRQSYGLIDPTSLSVKWKLEHSVQRGIGGYTAIPSLTASKQSIALADVYKAVEAGKRFYEAENGWLELSDNFKEQLTEGIKRGYTPFNLTPVELLGVSPQRLEQAELKLPKLSVAASHREGEKAENFLEAMRQYGLPAAIAGLQEDVSSVLAQLCDSIRFDFDAATILWVATRKRKDDVREALEPERLPFAGKIQIVSPEEAVPHLNAEWTLIIFQDVDILASSSAFVRHYAQLKRAWTVATFSKSEWFRNEKSLEPVLALFQLPPLAASAFRAHCVLRMPDQQDGFLAKLTSPFRKILTGSTDDDTGAMPIPPRSSARPKTPAPSKPSTSVFRPNFDLPLARITGNVQDFVAQAQLHANRTEVHAYPVPFMQYWPTYNAMNTAQQKWYFYWRTQLRAGDFQATDTSYLFVHVYEAINLVGFQSAQQAFDHLVRFWQHYRVLTPKLDNYLIDWLADFVVVHRLPITALDWYAQALQIGVASGDVDLSIEAWLQSGGDFDSLPNALLFQMAEYSPSKSKFYVENNQDGRLDKAYRKGLKAVDAYLRQKTQKSLLMTHQPGQSRQIVRQPFASALHSFGQTAIKIAEVRPWVAADTLTEQLKAIVKHSENIIRGQMGEKSKLRGITLLPEWKALLDKVFAPEPERRPVVIDLAKAAEYIADGQNIEKRFATDDALESAGEPAPPLVQPASEAPAVSTDIPMPSTVQSEESAAPLVNDLSGVQAIMQESQSIATKLLRLLRENNWQAPPATLEAALEGQFLNVILDQINERAYELLGDGLLFDESGVWVVTEDYRDEIGYLLDHQAALSAPVEVAAASTEPAENIYADLPEELAAFAQKMKPYHWEALAALLEGIEVEARLEAIARGVSLTTSRLLDDINDFALNTIGDIVVNLSEEPLKIEEEDIEGLTQLLAWASSKSLLEI